MAKGAREPLTGTKAVAAEIGYEFAPPKSTYVGLDDLAIACGAANWSAEILTLLRFLHALQTTLNDDAYAGTVTSS